MTKSGIQRLRNWCITLRMTINYTDKYWSEICTDTNIKYLVIGEIEKEDSEKNIHRHAYIELLKPRTLTSVKSLIQDNEAHLEPRLGSSTEARNYCIKEGLFFEYGEIGNSQGNRTDLHNMVKEVANGTTSLGTLLQESSTAVQYINCIKNAVGVIRYEENKTCIRKVEVIIYYGKSGTGKSYRAHTLYPNAYKVNRKQGNQIWWDNYNNEDTIIIDDFDGGVMSFDSWKIICDGYPMQLPIKGGWTSAAWTRVIITTVDRPENWWNCENYLNNPKQLFRRITKFIHCIDQDCEIEEKLDSNEE